MVGSSSTSSSRRRFFLRAAQLVLWLVLVDLVGGWVLSVMFFRQPVGRFHNTTYALEEMSEELVVLGSSRALHHYDTALIADRVDSTAYNAGSDGQSILYDHAVYGSATARYTPTVVILDVSPGMLEYQAESYARLSLLAPYSRRHPGLHDTLALRGPWEGLKQWSSLYRYNSVLPLVGGSFLLAPQPSDGFLPLLGPPRVLPDVQPMPAPAGRIADLDPEKTTRFEAMLQDAAGKGIRFIGVVSPILRPSRGEVFDASLAFVSASIEEHDAEMWCFLADSRFSEDRQLFIDRLHLNAEGANRFSELVAERLLEER